MIFIRMFPRLAFKEQVTWYLSHRSKHSRVIYSPADKLFLYHNFACLDVIVSHYRLTDSVPLFHKFGPRTQACTPLTPVNSPFKGENKGEKTFGRSEANRSGFPWLDAQHLDLEIESFPCERMIEIQNHGFGFN